MRQLKRSMDLRPVATLFNIDAWGHVPRQDRGGEFQDTFTLGLGAWQGAPGCEEVLEAFSSVASVRATWGGRIASGKEIRLRGPGFRTVMSDYASLMPPAFCPVRNISC